MINCPSHNIIVPPIKYFPFLIFPARGGENNKIPEIINRDINIFLFIIVTYFSLNYKYEADKKFGTDKKQAHRAVLLIFLYKYLQFGKKSCIIYLVQYEILCNSKQTGGKYMSVNLQKGQKVDLTKGNSGLKSLVVGLGWDEAPKKFSLFSKQEDIDCDASAILINAQTGKLNGPVDVVYYGQLMHRSGAVRHCGDNLTGAGDGDDEQIIVELNQVPADYSKIVFVVTIYQARERKQQFGMIRNAFIRIVDADTGAELCKYNLSENYDGKTAMIFGEVYRYNGEWKFGAIGEPTNDNGIADIAARFQ